MRIPNRLLAAKELFKYNYSGIVRLVERTRLLQRGVTADRSGEVEPLWSIFVIWACTTDCSYCVQNYSFINGRRDSPLRGILPPEAWWKLNDLPNRPEAIVITGGEPFLYPRLGELLAGLNGFKQVKVVTNLNIDPSRVIAKLSARAPRVSFECSYHEHSIAFNDFLARALMIKRAGLLGSVRVVDVHPSKTKGYIKEFALNGIKIVALFQVGTKGDTLQVLATPEASNLVRKPPVLCKTKLVLFAPNGDVYNCHTKLYWADKGATFGNIATGFDIPDAYLSCSDFGFCQPCQIGYMDIKHLDPTEVQTSSTRVLASNPPPTAVKSR